MALCCQVVSHGVVLSGGITWRCVVRWYHMTLCCQVVSHGVVLSGGITWRCVVRWYHGRLERATAEDRLRHACEAGSYLIRESDRKPGSYVLSFLGVTGINHFR